MQEIETFIFNLPKDEQIVLKRLRSMILQAEPRIREKLSLGVPYFSRNRRLFFLWPASVVSCELGPRKNPASPKVTLGFCYGNLLSNEQRLLTSEGRKQVYTIKINSLSDVDERVLAEILNEAVLIDQQFFRKNK